MNETLSGRAPELWLWIAAGSSAVSAAACLMIAAAAISFLRRRADLARVARRIGWLLVAFLVAVAVTHLTQAVAARAVTMRFEAVARLVTAAVSLGAAVLVWPQLPKLMRLPSPRDLSRSNAALAQANASLETTIAWRTHELRLANERFETALSRANITVYTQDRDLAFTWLHNPQPGLTPDAPGPATDQTTPEAAMDMARGVVETGAPASGPISVTSSAGDVRYYDLLCTPTRDPLGHVDGVLCTALDVTDKRLFDVRLASMAGQVASAYHRFELALENSQISVFEQDRDLRYTFVHNPPAGTSADEFLDRTDEEIFPVADLRRLGPAKREVTETSAREALELELTLAGAKRFFDIRLEPKIDGDGTVTGVISTLVDFTERQRSEKHMRLVMRELTHRSKNLLAVVQAMARKTASMSPDVDTFIRDFSSRLRAIAASHDLLVAESWAGAELRDLLVASLSQTVDPASAGISIDGARLTLLPDTAQTLGLAFHELTTNATRHGALSAPGGTVSVGWQRADGKVRLEWRERGGPGVGRPTRSGFGRILLERLTGASLGGEASLDFEPEGLVYTLTFPDDRLATS
jgi:two-component sensor histidine kinase